MIITKFETWWVERGRCLFDEKRQGGAKMGWDVIAIKLTTDTGIEGVATCMAARSGAVSEAYLQESIGPVVLGRDPHDREAIFQELWTIDRHEAFFPVFLPGPVDVALWDICAKEAGLPLYKTSALAATACRSMPAATSTALLRSMWTRLSTTRAKAFPATKPIRAGRSALIWKCIRPSATLSAPTTC